MFSDEKIDPANNTHILVFEDQGHEKLGTWKLPTYLVSETNASKAPSIIFAVWIEENRCLLSLSASTFKYDLKLKLNQQQNDLLWTMATAINTSTSASPNVPLQAAVPELPPAIAAFIEALRPTMYILIVSAVWLGIAIPILVILFFNSTKKLRRSAIFINNAIAICIGITMGILNAAIQVRSSKCPKRMIVKNLLGVFLSDGRNAQPGQRLESP